MRRSPNFVKNCSIYATKTFSLVPLLLVLSALAAAAAWFVFHQDPQLVAEILAGPPLLAALLVIALRRPVIRIDKNGVAYHPRSLPRIGWADVAGVDRAPMVEPTVDGLIHHPTDGRRPVLVVLRSPDKYLRRLPNALQTGLMVERETGDVCFRLDFTGLPSSSAKVYGCIRQRLVVSAKEVA
ncbi:MAG: hypothetical protein INR65_07615 [Gluconacetobacter diazotrophicus]|nr:hypothetical protein [Gluconacetobacter diazotrophicus]